ncbi:FAD-dependent monooxygenase [Streptomyces caatingaensis]|uniref:Oxidoreductase n=1 Tax=Streptomyces caatingaensis TaxID=1678637 RepID=A0A0K9XFL2_9ACTN|nr:FAD-dependent monooxygenase [Streptomyces caatingaensis]KNB52160.1 oxidoreductase [Streptomyces caatingaensis]
MADGSTTVVTTDVLVVGGGPVGLMLAGELRLGGAEVTVLERRTGPTTESRASTLHARTMELLDGRGLLGRLGTPPRELRGHFGGIPLGLALPGPHPGQWKVPQGRTEELLEEWARALGAALLRGHTLHALTAGEDHVEGRAAGPDGTVVVRAAYAVACDGEDSTVRRLLAPLFPGHDARRELLRADVAGIDVPDRRFERLPGGLAVAARRADGVTRVMVHAFGSVARRRTAEPEFGEVAAVWERVTGERIGHGTPLWVNAFGDASRQLARYRHGRVLYAGDAAHRQMPVGGQALNLGLQDAVNLGWKLAATVRGGAPPGLLDSYDTERRAVGRRVLENIGIQAGLLLGGAGTEPLRALLGELIPLEEVRVHLAGTISGLDVRYAMGPGTDRPPLGARLPLLPLVVAGAPATSFHLLRTGGGVLLDLAGHDRLRAAAAPWADRVRYTAARLDGPRPEGLPDGTHAVLLRPDGHVAWAAEDGRASEDGLRAALRRWFGEPGEAAA